MQAKAYVSGYQKGGGAWYSTRVDRIRAIARKVLEIEAEAVAQAAERVNDSMERAARLILAHPGKLVLSGVGKSGHIARKLASTFQSTGTPAVFLHPGEAAHGDLGVVQVGDPLIVISKSGTTSELVDLAAAVREKASPVIAVVGNMKSALARVADVVLDASVQREADPEGFVPTSSIAVALALGHALAVAVMQERGFRAADFGKLHLGGQLGRNLNLQVADVMHRNGEVAWVRPGDSLRQVVIEMTHHPLGACVVLDDERMAGLITDGDVRRALEVHDDIRALTASKVMTVAPISVSPGARVHDALRIMEDRPSQISVLPVVEDGRCLGLIRLHDIYRPAPAED